MSNNQEGTRKRAEERLAMWQSTPEQAKKVIDTDLTATRKKTERLKALRLTSSTAEQAIGEPDNGLGPHPEKPVPAKRPSVEPKARRLAFKWPLAENHRDRPASKWEK